MANMPSDSLMLTVMQSIMDTSRSYLEVKEELFMFIDTMQSHVEFHPNSEIRVGAKSFADLIAQLLLAPEFNTPEEMRFTIDSVIEPITDVRSTWYYQSYEDGSHSLSQHILKYNEQTNANDIVHLEVVADEKGELLIVSMPNKNYHFTSIAFSGDSIFEIDTIGFYRDDAKYIDILEDDSTEYVIFGSDCIEQMLSHQAIFIGYIDEDGYIYLSRFGLIRRFNSQGQNISIPDPMTVEVGRMLGTDSGTLDESNTHITIGHFTGNKFAAAAAFVCLVYECHNNYKHRRFFEGWY
jgi:hypothetical protein